MKEFTLNQLSKFSEILHDDYRIIKLNKIEKDVLTNNKVQELSKIFKDREEKYNFALEHYGENSELTNKAKAELLSSKNDLDSNDLVKEYNEAFIVVKDLYREIDNALFSDIKDNIICKECHD